MKKRTKIATCIFIFVMCGYTYNTSCFAFNDEGFQLWSGASASFDINKEWKGKFEEEFRLGDDGGNLYYQHSDIGVTYTGLADWLDLGFNYRYVFEKDSSEKWREENRPHFNVTAKGLLLGLEVSDRSRFEYREREIKEDVWRYRNKITLKLPFVLTDLKLQPYIADEFFITLNDDNIDRNRLYFGLPFKLSENFKTDLFYLWQSSRSSREWKDISVIGVYLKFNF
ncbi:MAG: DUF2490 domain-containing protein [Sedimentisphaerales bacterium]|nr:DUF2490 domain-containing protein [Sedimentisphaerales bacterium]